MLSGNPGRVVVVGGSLAGLRTAEALRAGGHTDEVVVIGEEPHLPYNRPPLSKALLMGTADLDQHLLAQVDPGAVTWRLGVRAVGSDLAAGKLQLADGSTESFDALVVATGLRARRLNLPGPSGGRYVVRTFDDACALGAELVPGARVVVIGASFIGCEVAGTARAAGCDVVVVAPEAEPMDRVLGAELGAAMRRRHEKTGVRFRLGTVPVAFEDPAGTGRVGRIVLADGSVVTANVVVEAVGCVPEVDWLAGNELNLSDGVLCDNALRVEGRNGVVAAGDVARFPNPLIDDVPRRIEHWTSAGDAARRAAATLLGQDPDPFRPVPGFWSDQLGLRIQAYGVPALADRHRVETGDVDGDVVLSSWRGEQLVGVTGIGHRKALMAARRRLVEAARSATTP